jgi:hypothetical protein
MHTSAIIPVGLLIFCRVFMLSLGVTKRFRLSWGGGGGVEERASSGGVSLRHDFRAGIFKKSMGARHRVGLGLSYRPARLYRLAELMP